MHPSTGEDTRCCCCYTCAWSLVHPNMQASAHYRSLLYQQGAAPFWRTSINAFSSMGIGIVLHFKLLKYFFWFFFLASVLALPYIVLCVNGSRVSEQHTDVLRLARVTVANIGDAGPIANYTLSGYMGYAEPLSSRTLSLVATSTDLVISTAFLIFCAIVSCRVRRLSAKRGWSLFPPAEYAVFVEGLPPDTTEAEVREHFNKLYNLHERDWTYPSSCWNACYMGRKMVRRTPYQPVSQLYLHLPDTSPTLNKRSMMARTQTQQANDLNLHKEELHNDDVFPVAGTLSVSGAPQPAVRASCSHPRAPCAFRLQTAQTRAIGTTWAAGWLRHPLLRSAATSYASSSTTRSCCIACAWRERR
ncbi:RNA-binding protein, partial [archaeon]